MVSTNSPLSTQGNPAGILPPTSEFLRRFWLASNLWFLDSTYCPCNPPQGGICSKAGPLEPSTA
jgi:hypothetical protein